MLIDTIADTGPWLFRFRLGADSALSSHKRRFRIDAWRRGSAEQLNAFGLGQIDQAEASEVEQHAVWIKDVSLRKAPLPR